MKTKNSLHEFCVEKIRFYRNQICEEGILSSSLGKFLQVDLMQSPCTADIFEVVITIEILLELFFAGEVIGCDGTKEELGQLQPSPEENVVPKDDISFMKLRKKFLKDIEFDYMSVINTLTASALSIMKFVLAREEKRRSSYSEYKGEEIIIESDAAIIADLSLASVLRCIYSLILKRREIKVKIDKYINNNRDENVLEFETLKTLPKEFDEEDSDSMDKNIGDNFPRENSKIEIMTRKFQDVSIKSVENWNKNKIEVGLKLENDDTNRSNFFRKKCSERKKNIESEEKNIFLSLKGFCLILGGSGANVRLSGKEIMDRTTHEIFLDMRSLVRENNNKNIDDKIKNNKNMIYNSSNDEIDNNFYLQKFPFDDIICELNLQKVEIHTKNNSKNDENFVVISSNNLELAEKIFFEIKLIEKNNKSEKRADDSKINCKKEILNSFEIEKSRKKEELQLLEREEQVTNVVLSLARIWGFWPVSSLSSCLCAHGFLFGFLKIGRASCRERVLMSV